jgi:hypothetical protein
LIERVFQAGAKLQSRPAGFDTRQADCSVTEMRSFPWITEDELPAAVRYRNLFHLKRALGWDGEAGRCIDTEPEGLVLIRMPTGCNLPSKLRGRWFNSASDGQNTFANQIVGCLLKLGLYGEPVEFDDGSMVTQMTEWGYELFTLGAKRAVEDRMIGRSRSFNDFKGLTGRDLRNLFLRLRK